MRLLLTAVLSGLVTIPAAASELLVTVEIPKLDVAEYHRPYLAFWLETPQGAAAASLAVWYDVDLRNDEGETWLKDLRQWWRRIGRATDMPVDGVSGATRPPGTHEIAFDAADPRLAALPPGTYEFVIEASREVGGRELLRGKLNWPLEPGQALRLAGERELGAVTVSLKP